MGSVQNTGQVFPLDASTNSVAGLFNILLGSPTATRSWLSGRRGESGVFIMPDFVKLGDNSITQLFDQLFDDKIPFDPHLPHCYQSHVHEILDSCPWALDIAQFVDAWKVWKAGKGGSSRGDSSAAQVEEAFEFATCAASLGLLYIAGRGSHCRIWLAPVSEAPVYERISSSSGRLAIPPNVRGTRRASVQKRHAEIARPIIKSLLERLAIDPAPAWIAKSWFDNGLVPTSLKGATYLQAQHVLYTIHENLSIHRQIFWMCILRSRLLELGFLPHGDMPVAPPPEDYAALASLAPPA